VPTTTGTLAALKVFGLAASSQLENAEGGRLSTDAELVTGSV